MTPEDIRNGLLKALQQAQEGKTLLDLENMLSSGEALLWRGERGVLVTILYDHGEDGKSLHVWLGTGDMDDLVAMEPGVSAWARARGCRFATINGRKGWYRIFKDLGFKMIDGELRKDYV